MQPNQAWVADITCFRTHSGWLYLAAVLDLYGCNVVGRAMAPDMRSTLVCHALQLAIAQRQPLPGLIIHPDRGSPLGFKESLQHQLLYCWTVVDRAPLQAFAIRESCEVCPLSYR